MILNNWNVICSHLYYLYRYPVVQVKSYFLWVIHDYQQSPHKHVAAAYFFIIFISLSVKQLCKCMKHVKKLSLHHFWSSQFPFNSRMYLERFYNVLIMVSVLYKSIKKKSFLYNLTHEPWHDLLFEKHSITKMQNLCILPSSNESQTLKNAYVS